MNIFNADKIMNRLDKMLDNAISAKPTETTFDETKMSALKTKFSRYLAMTETSRAQLLEEKSERERIPVGEDSRHRGHEQLRNKNKNICCRGSRLRGGQKSKPES